jgi:hypothetical protein
MSRSEPLIAEPQAHASESGHWYDRQGNSVWEVPGAKGQLVKPDIRHARKLGLLPGVTSISRCAASPGLERYKVEQGILAAYTLPPVAGESYSDWLARVFRDSEAHGRQAADRGTAIHAAIQGHYQGEPPDEEFLPYVQLVSRVVMEKCGEQQWTAEKSFGCEKGYGGKSDLSCDVWLLDFKSKDAKDLDDPGKKLVYDDHAQQLAAYRRGLRIPRARCANVFVSRDEPVIVRFCEHSEEDLARGLQMFDHLLAYWQTKNRYDSSFTNLLRAA